MASYKSLSTGQTHDMGPANPGRLAFSEPMTPKPGSSTKKRKSYGSGSIPPFAPTPSRDLPPVRRASSGMSYWEERRAPIEQVGPVMFSGGLPQALPQQHRGTDLPKIAVTPWTTDGSLRHIRRAGGEPVFIQSNTPTEVLEECGGLLIPGGRDVDPALYGEKSAGSQFPDRDRDEYEITLIKYAMRHKMAILGICRGHQLLNVAMGGSLVQDMSPGHTYKHPVRFDADHVMFKTVKGLEMIVNSLHHQSIKEVGKGLLPVAWSPDGTVEAVVHEKRRFVVGVQWHPEMSLTPRFDRGMEQLLWNRFIRAGRETAAKRAAHTKRLAQEN
jgi:putative glutamine amidotransferase